MGAYEEDLEIVSILLEKMIVLKTLCLYNKGDHGRLALKLIGSSR